MGRFDLFLVDCLPLAIPLGDTLRLFTWDTSESALSLTSLQLASLCKGMFSSPQGWLCYPKRWQTFVSVAVIEPLCFLHVVPLSRSIPSSLLLSSRSKHAILIRSFGRFLFPTPPSVTFSGSRCAVNLTDRLLLIENREDSGGRLFILSAHCISWDVQEEGG